MKNSLVDKLKGAGKKVWNAGKKVVLPIAAGTLLYLATTQNVSGQNKDNQDNVYSYGRHNTGATIGKDKIRVKDGKDFEIKVIKGRGEYFQNIPLTIKGFPTNPKKISNADLANTFKDTLNLISFYKETAQYDFDAYTKGILQVSSKEPNQWVKAKDEQGNYLNVIPLSLKINPKTGKPEIYAEILCDGQLNKKNGVTDKNASYIAKEKLEDILKQLTNNLSTLNLNRKINEQTINTNFYFPSASDSTVYLIPNIEDYTKLRILPATKNEKGVTSRIRQVAIVSPLGVYEKVRTDGEVTIDNVPTSSVSGTSIDPYSDKNVTSSQKKSEKATSDSTKTKGNLYLMIVGEASAEYVGGGGGIGGDHFKLKGIYGQGFDKMTESFTTAVSPNTGRYGVAEKYIEDIKVIGGDVSYAFGDKWQFGLGAGANKWDYTQRSVEKIMSAQNIIKENTNSVSKSEVSGKAYAELTKKIGEALKVSGFIGYDTKAKTIGGITVQVPINRK